jgi:hypothetical protein
LPGWLRELTSEQAPHDDQHVVALEGCMRRILLGWIALGTLALPFQAHAQTAHPSPAAAPSANGPHGSFSTFIWAGAWYGGGMFPTYPWAMAGPYYGGGPVYNSPDSFSPFNPNLAKLGANWQPRIVPPQHDKVKSGMGPKIVKPAMVADPKARAEQFIHQGDLNFAQRKYAAALARYRTAGELADTTAELALRQGFALVALGQPKNAANAFRRGLASRSDWSDSQFQSEVLYREDQASKSAHLDRLCRALETSPSNPDLLLALGIELYFDGQHERAALFLRRAAEVDGDDARLFVPLLPTTAVAKPPQDGSAVKPVFH